MTTAPRDVSHLLGQGSLLDLLVDPGAAFEVGLDWCPPEVLERIVNFYKNDPYPSREFTDGLVALCQAEQRRRELEDAGRPADPVFFRVAALSASACHVFNGQNDTAAALFFFLTSAQLLEQMAALNKTKH